MKYGVFVPLSPHSTSRRLLAVVEVLDAGPVAVAHVDDEVRAHLDAERARLDATVAEVLDLIGRADGVTVKPVDEVVHTVRFYVDEETENGALDQAAMAAEVQWTEPGPDDLYFCAYGTTCSLDITEDVIPVGPGQ